MNNKTHFGYSDICEVYNCKPRWTKGKGAFKGWKIKLCKKHQIIHAMKKEQPKGE